MPEKEYIGLESVHILLLSNNTCTCMTLLEESIITEISFFGATNSM